MRLIYRAVAVGAMGAAGITPFAGLAEAAPVTVDQFGARNALGSGPLELLGDLETAYPGQAAADSPTTTRTAWRPSGGYGAGRGQGDDDDCSQGDDDGYGSGANGNTWGNGGSGYSHGGTGQGNGTGGTGQGNGQ